MNRLLIIAACIPLVVSCGRPAGSFHSYPPGYPGSYAAEGVTIRMPSNSVKGFLNALRRASTALTGGSLQANLWNGASSGSTRADVGVYTAAMRDARMKAQSVASFMHTSLGSATAVSEIFGNSPGQSGAGEANAGTMTEKVMIAHPPVIQVGSHGPVVLAVRYRLANGGTISVFGLSNALAHGEAQGLNINLVIRGANAAQVNRRLDRYMQVLRGVAKRKGLSDTAITFTSLSFG